MLHGLTRYRPPVAAMTWNPSDKAAAIVLSGGNLVATKSTDNFSFDLVRATIGKAAGKYYCEFVITSKGGDTLLGVCSSAQSLTGSTTFPGSLADSYGVYELNGNKYNNNVGSAYLSVWSAGDVIGMAVDHTNGKIWWHRNGTYPSSGDPAAGTNPAFTGLTGTKYPTVAIYEAVGATITARFASASWGYAAPSGFVAYS